METKKTLYRDTDNKMLGGVASGLSEYMGWDVTVTRLVFVFCLFLHILYTKSYVLAINSDFNSIVIYNKVTKRINKTPYTKKTLYFLLMPFFKKNC